MVRHRPADLEALGHLGSAFARQGRHTEGLTLLRVAQRHQPGDARVLSTLGLVLLDAGRPAETIPVLERSLEIEPRSAPSLAGLAVAHMATGNEARARVLQRTLGALDPGLAARIAPATRTR